jgi:cyclopropane-fatty-acyl-phospholipid synthase
MFESQIKNWVKDVFSRADVQIDGQRPWDIRVNDQRFYRRLFWHGSLGLGEAYMEGWWEAEQLDELFYRLCSGLPDKKQVAAWKRVSHWLEAVVMNLQSKRRAFIVGEEHYDTDNRLFERMLDKRMAYSCGYWKEAADLDEAQEAKLELICRKLGLEKGMTLLDIGCGWGSLAGYAAEKYQVKVTGITVSREQLELAKERCRSLSVELILQDYRDVKGSFDRVVSVGQMEHVGYKNYREYFRIMHRCLKEKGLFLLHTIGSNVSEKYGEPWMDKYIFPNGMLPSIKQLSASSEGLFVMEDWHNFGIYYDKTLMAWYRNFVCHWEELRARYDEKFNRMWSYYLLSCAGAFRARRCQLWQLVLSKEGVAGGYPSIR